MKGTGRKGNINIEDRQKTRWIYTGGDIRGKRRKEIVMSHLL